MSTELKPTGAFTLTQYSNRDRAGPAQSDFLCLQITQGLGMNPHKPGFVNVNRADAAELCAALAEWLAGTRQEFGSF